MRPCKKRPERSSNAFLRPSKYPKEVSEGSQPFRLLFVSAGFAGRSLAFHEKRRLAGALIFMKNQFLTASDGLCLAEAASSKAAEATFPTRCERQNVSFL